MYRSLCLCCAIARFRMASGITLLKVWPRVLRKTYISSSEGSFSNSTIGWCLAWKMGSRPNSKNYGLYPSDICVDILYPIATYGDGDVVPSQPSTIAEALT